MPKTFSEIKDDLRALKDEIFMAGDNADVKMVETYLDRLVQSVSDMAESMEAMEASVECACECCESCAMPAPKAKPAAKKKAKAKKPAKKKRK